ncbi:hypothetical protein FCV25MIE_28018 [Fagus crenata]
MKNYGTQEAGDNATPQETENTMWPVIEIGGVSSSVTPPKAHQTQDVHGLHLQQPVWFVENSSQTKSL